MRALTEAKAAELVASEARYRRLAAATFEGIIFSADGRLVDFNDQLLGMLGYRREELIGMAIADLLPAEDRARVLANIEQGSESRIEHEIIRKDGLRLQVEAHGQCFDNGHTRITALRAHCSAPARSPRSIWASARYISACVVLGLAAAARSRWRAASSGRL